MTLETKTLVPQYASRRDCFHEVEGFSGDSWAEIDTAAEWMTDQYRKQKFVRAIWWIAIIASCLLALIAIVFPDTNIQAILWSILILVIIGFAIAIKKKLFGFQTLFRFKEPTFQQVANQVNDVGAINVIRYVFDYVKSNEPVLIENGVEGIGQIVVPNPLASPFGKLFFLRGPLESGIVNVPMAALHLPVYYKRSGFLTKNETTLENERWQAELPSELILFRNEFAAQYPVAKSEMKISDIDNSAWLNKLVQLSRILHSGDKSRYILERGVAVIQDRQKNPNVSLAGGRDIVVSGETITVNETLYRELINDGNKAFNHRIAWLFSK